MQEDLGKRGAHCSTIPTQHSTKGRSAAAEILAGRMVDARPTRRSSKMHSGRR